MFTQNCLQANKIMIFISAYGRLVHLHSVQYIPDFDPVKLSTENIKAYPKPGNVEFWENGIISSAQT